VVQDLRGAFHRGGSPLRLRDLSAAFGGRLVGSTKIPGAPDGITDTLLQLRTAFKKTRP